MSIWDQLGLIEKASVCVVVIGSIVDIFQFTWLLKRAYVKAKRALYNRVRQELLLSQYKDKIEKDLK